MLLRRLHGIREERDQTLPAWGQRQHTHTRGGQAYVCVGIPSPNDPSGCRDRREVGPVRVFSPASAPAPPGEAGPGPEPGPEP